MELKDIGAVVTGGGSGLGEATARLFAEKGARVAILDRNIEAAGSVAQAIGGMAVGCDVADASSAEHAMQEVVKALGAVRVLVNCAGIGPAGRVVGRDGPMPLADFERVIDVNLIGTFNILRLAATHMSGLDETESGRGVIVNTASVAAFDGQIGQAAYAASKGAIVSLALPVARELARFSIRVNTIAPGIFLTPLLKSLPEDVQKSLGESIPSPKRLGEPREFADAVRFCVENDYLNGEVIRLDGAIRMAPK